MSATTLAACGKDDDEGEKTAPQRAPQIVRPLTPEERVKNCFLRVDPEQGNDWADRIHEIMGTWTHHSSDMNPGFRKKEFRFDMAARIAAITTYEDNGKNVDDLVFKKACISKPLASDFGGFEGYRLLELLAEFNEGAVAFFFKLEGSGANASLLISDSQYQRWGQDYLVDPHKFLQGTAPIKVWVYTDRK